MNPTRHSLRSRLLLAAALLFAPVTATAACSPPAPAASGGGTVAVTYQPAAYGVQVAVRVFHCYYLETPIEVTDLVSAGLCPRGSVAILMPVAWEEMYYGYYSSSSYYGRYMPHSYWSSYTKIVITFKAKNSRQIDADASKGTYKTSTGKTVTGVSGSALKYGTAGTSRNAHSPGAGRAPSACSMPMKVLTDSGASSSSSRHSGGYGRSGSSTTSSTTSHAGSRGC